MNLDIFQLINSPLMPLVKLCWLKNTLQGFFHELAAVPQASPIRVESSRRAARCTEAVLPPSLRAQAQVAEQLTSSQVSGHA